MIFLVQFGINKHELIFQRLAKLHEPHGASAIWCLWKKSCDYLFIIYMKKCGMVKQKKRTRIT